jgi:DNA-directed RNA polymerase specialized sigma24 family protein
MTFEEFASAQLPAVLRFAVVLAGDRAAAEDLAQEVLIRACSPLGPDWPPAPAGVLTSAR